jgi:cobalt-zinc-cadmium efflux system protein
MGSGHAHDHHGHGHAHDHAPADFGRAFAIGIVLNFGFVVVEATYGFLADSVALIADAGHNLSDVLGLVVAWAGATMARRSRSPRFTFGLKKASILAALINSFFLLLAIGAIGAEAIRRLFNPADPHGPTVIAVAAVGIVVNGLTALLFARGRSHDINVRAAFQHMMADAGVSAAVVFAGALILWTGQNWVDPVMSLAIAFVILWGSLGLFKESVGMSLAGVPPGIELDEVEAALAGLEGVADVHDLHVWPLSTTEIALTAHLLVPSGADDALLGRARALVRERFNIDHCTIQVETGRHSAGAHADCRHC